jgi:hypothetical protein
MTPPHEVYEEFLKLMGDLREGIISEDQKIRLDALLGQYALLRQAYVDYILLWHELRCNRPMSEAEHSCVAQRMDIVAIEREAQRRLDRFLAEEERIRSMAQRPEPRYLPDLAGTVLGIYGWIASLYRLIAGAAVLAAIALAIVLVVQYVRTTPVVASLADSMNATWEGELGPSIANDTPLRQGPFRLRMGCAHIVFQKGAGIWIEAPAEFRLTSDRRMTLYSGQLFAEVPPAAVGFTVDTPHTRIVDLGTEFGVKVDSGSGSDLHLFKGKASLTPTGGAVRGDKSEIVAAGQASSVDAAGRIKSIPVNTTTFVRRFSSTSGSVWRGQSIDLADVVGGGNGFGTGQLNRWLEISTGLDGTRYIVNGQITQQHQTTDNRYHRVTHLRYVDGVFSPDGSAGPVQVSSERHFWQNGPKTAGTYFEDIFNGDYISVGASSHGLVLTGQAFGTREHPGIALHSNAGITFDVDAMRRAMPGLEITEFKALCGVSEDVKKHPEDTQQGKSDLWVLVDGEKRFEAIGMDANSRPREISVPLSGPQRFLTLVTTDGDGRTNCDWCLFAEPRLEVRTVQ